MKFNISNEEVKTILEMHSNEKKNTFLIKEDATSDLERLRIAISAGCLKGGSLKRSKSTGNVFYRKPSAKDPSKEVDFFADMTFKFVDGSQSGKWKCDAIETTLASATNKAAQDAAALAKNAASLSASTENINKIKQEGGWKSYEELIQIDTKENISNPAMYEKKVIDGIDLYRRKGSNLEKGLGDKAQSIIDEYKSKGYKLKSELTPEEIKTFKSQVVSPASDGYFPQDLVMYFDPSTVQGVGQLGDEKTNITTVIQNAVESRIPTDKKDCKDTIEAYYISWKKKRPLKPNEFNALKSKAQACKNEFYGDWGPMGGGKVDEIIDIMTGVKMGGPTANDKDSVWRLM